MKKIIKTLSILTLITLTLVVGNKLVDAANTAPSTFKAETTLLKNKPLGLSTYNVNVKKTTDGKYVYCLDVNKKLPTKEILYTKANEITDLGLAYIIGSGVEDKTDYDFFATQAAAWIYLYNKSEMKDTSNGYIKSIINAINSSTYGNTTVAKDIKSLLSNAKNANNESKYLTISTKDVTFTLKKGVYTSSPITVRTNIDYIAAIANQPKDTEIIKNGNTITIKVPASSLGEGLNTFELNVAGSAVTYKAYRYTPSNNAYQDMLAGYEDTELVRDSLMLSITTKVTPTPDEPEDNTVIIISKKDAETYEYVKGATLVIKDSRGREVLRWKTTSTSKRITNLEVGTYTLEEISAPSGYVLSKEIKEFEVKEDGKTKRINFYNYKEEEKDEKGIVYISKQDVTDKEELPGATLIVRDSTGKEIERWVSTDKPHKIKLDAGTYTLEEITAPKGYKLSSEKITFEVKKNGVVTEVVMFNTPESTVIVVPPTGVNKSIMAYILGGLVITLGCVVVYRNVKKEQ